MTYFKRYLTHFWAHLCICTVGSYALHSVCLYVFMSATWPKFKLDKKSCRRIVLMRTGKTAYIQPTLHVHYRYTTGILQFKLGPIKGRWAHFNVKLHFWRLILTKIADFLQKRKNFKKICSWIINVPHCACPKFLGKSVQCINTLC